MSVTELLTKDEVAKATKKVVEKSPCAKKTDSIHETLKRIREQLEGIPIVDLNPLLEALNQVIVQQQTIIDLLNQKLSLDVYEQEIMDLIKADIEGKK